MNPFLVWLEATPLSTWIRESTSVFAYPAILSAHAIGMGLAAGINCTLALRLLGVAPRVPVPEMRRFVPFMWLGFWLNLVSGIILLIAYPTKALTNPLFYVKIGLIVLGMRIFFLLRRRLFAESAVAPVGVVPLKVLAAGALISWSGAIISGRLLAYTYTRLFASWK